MGAFTVDPRLRAAVDASLSWYDALCALHGARCGIDVDTWLAYDSPPPLHSIAKTVEPSALPQTALRMLEHYERGSIADSFGAFDLTPEGLDILFDARWVFHPAPPTAARRLPDGWTVVESASALARWTAYHDTAEVLLPGLLDRSSFRVLARHADGLLVGGAVTHLCSGVVEISNVWAWHDTADWNELVAAAAALHPGRPIVGYEHGAGLAQAIDAGFVDVGPQVVWIRR
jgi:hypothetical protein